MTQDDVLQIVLNRLDSIAADIGRLRTEVSHTYLPRTEYDARHNELKEDIEDLTSTVKDLNKRLYIGVGIAIAISAFLPLLYHLLING